MSTVPPYGDYKLIEAYQQNGLIFIVFQSDKDNVYAIYDWLEIGDDISIPLLMKGGITFSVSQVTSKALNIISSQKGGFIYFLFSNKTISAYRVMSNAYLDCTFQSHKDLSLTYYAYNSFTQGSLEINFNYIEHKRWFIGLITFVGTFFLIAAFIYWYKTRKIQNIDNSVEVSLGLEL